MKEPTRGYWCECWTEDLTDKQGRILRASFDAYSAAQADRWIAVALRTLPPALDPDAFDEAWTWLYDGRIDTRRALHGDHHPGRHARDLDGRPVLFLPLARRQGSDLPACAHTFTPHTTD